MRFTTPTNDSPGTMIADQPGSLGVGGKAPPSFWQQAQMQLVPQQMQSQTELSLAGMNNAAANQRAQLEATQSGANARLAAGASTLAPRLQQQRFDQIFPMLSGVFNNASSFGTSGGGYQPMQSAIQQGPIWNDQQIQQQVNAAQAQAQQRGGTVDRGISQSTASRGYGAGSPLEMALKGQNQAAVNSAVATAGREIPWQAAQGNAQQQLASGQALNQFNLGQQANQIDAQKALYGQQSALLSALSGLV